MDMRSVLVWVLAIGLGSGDDSVHYAVVAPGSLLVGAGAANRLCLSRLGRAAAGGTARLQLHVLPSPADPAAADTDSSPPPPLTRLRKDFPQGNGGCFDVVLPAAAAAHSRVDLHLRIRLTAADDGAARTDERVWRGVRVLGGARAGVLLAQTDRPLYRAGDVVLLRLLRLRPDLLPAHAPVRRVWLEAPPAALGGRMRVAQWERVRTQLGLAHLQYALDQYAPEGEWRIYVETEEGGEGGEEMVAKFTVAEYSLPSVQLTVNHPTRLLRNTPSISWTVCARHAWGEGARGTLWARVHGDGDGHGGAGGAGRAEGMVRRLLGGASACHTHALDAGALGLTAALRDQPNVIVADFAFQEESTKTWTNTSAISRFVEDTTDIEFINKNKMYISPGLPYKIKLRVKDWDDKGVAGAAVRVCRAPSADCDHTTVTGANEACETLHTDQNGFAHISFNVPSDIAAHCYRIQATAREARARLSLRVAGGGGGGVHAALGALGGGLRHHLPLYLSYPPRAAVLPLTVHFMLVTRGGTIFRWGASTQCPRPASAPLAPAAAAAAPAEGASCLPPAAERSLLRVALPARVTHQMCPHSHVLAYFLHDGRLVVASKRFKLDECFYNKVESRWRPDVVPPGGAATLEVASLGPALCAVSARDAVLKQALGGEPVTLQEHLLEQLRLFIDIRNNITAQDSQPQSCYRDNGTSNELADEYDYIDTIFRSAGMRLLSDAVPACAGDGVMSSPAPAPLERPSAVVPAPPHDRTFFPESWLWGVHALPASGALLLNVTAPDAVTLYESDVTCVSRSGVSVSPPATLRVFRPFFVELDAPRRIKRGETTQFFYKIFNYMDLMLAVTVEVETAAEGGVAVRGAGGGVVRAHTACVAARDAYSVRLGVEGLRAGAWRLAVRATAAPHMQHRCGGGGGGRDPLDTTGDYPSDKIVKEIVVEPEGELIEKYHSCLLCAEEDGGGGEGGAAEVTWRWEAAARGGEVEGTALWRLWVVGDLAGPVDVNADALVSLPLGCGEQNMARLAHNLAALRHLRLRNHTAATASTSSAERARDNILAGSARQLRYAHARGGFSAFGLRNESPSTWLTAFCARYLPAAAAEVRAAARWDRTHDDWLLSLQMENGCFQNVGQVFHREFKGGIDSDASNIGLTAYVLVSLMEAGTVLRPSALRGAADCLRALSRAGPRAGRAHVYPLALVAYAQARLVTYERRVRARNDAGEGASGREARAAGGDGGAELAHSLGALRAAARRDADLVWWETDSLETSIESTAYAVLAMLAATETEARAGGLDDAAGAVRWLSLHRNPAGGFLSTQATLVGLEALAAWAAAAGGARAAPQLLVSVSAPGLSATRPLAVTPRTRHVLHAVVARAPPATSARASERTLRVSVSGFGCVLIQATQQYNSVLPGAVPPVTSPFTLQARVRTDGTFDCRHSPAWCRCAAQLELCVTWKRGNFPEMAIMEVDLPTGYVADKKLLYGILSENNILLRRLEEREEAGRMRVVLYLAAGTGTVRTMTPGKMAPTHECYRLYLMGPQSRTAPARIRLYDYYHAHLNTSLLYTVPEACPERAPHSDGGGSGRALGSDNLYRGPPPASSLRELDSVEAPAWPNSSSSTSTAKDFSSPNVTRVNANRPSDTSNGGAPSSSPRDPFTGFHVVENETDLEVPDGVEGVPPVTVLPPPLPPFS